MAERKTFSVPKPIKTRPSTVSVATSSRTRVPGTAVKDRNQRPASKINKNVTLIGDADITINRQESVPDYDAEHRQIAYGKFMRTMLEDCLLDEKITRQETEIDIQMAQLADRFQKTMDQMDKTNRRIKDIQFIVEKKRLLDLKKNDCSQFYEMSESANTEELLKDISAKEEACLDKLTTKNVNFGYNKDSGHKQLLDAVTDAIDGLDNIKKHSNLSVPKFQEYEKTKATLEHLKTDRFDLDSMKADFEARFARFNEKLLKEATERISEMIENGDEDEDD